MIEIIDINCDFVIIYKPWGMPSQSDPSGDKDAMTETAEALLAIGEENSLWLIHRLDRTVGGLLVFARNQRSARELSLAVQSDVLGKYYLAVTDGLPEGGVMKDLIYKDARLSKAFVVDRKRGGVKEAELTLTPISEREGKGLSEVKLKTGRYHQIRVQLSHRAHPIVGDGKYGSRDKGARTPALFAYKLEFALFGRAYTYTKMPSTEEYPWSLFREEIKSEGR
ncbi:MAG: RNA pseudouridine synthase [Clostridia bacterium]|nr:RNA pseudouridine synthase [Clostridia bacterium]